MARGRGVAVLGADNIFTGERDTCVATVCEVAVNLKTGVVKVERVVIAQDCGLVVNPDAVKNQLEGAVIQSISRALMEEATFNRSRVTSLDWASYPIIRFPDIPDEIDIVLANRPDLPPMRVGEPASETIWPAIANAIYDALGERLRRLPNGDRDRRPCRCRSDTKIGDCPAGTVPGRDGATETEGLFTRCNHPRRKDRLVGRSDRD